MAWPRIDAALDLASQRTRFFRGPITVTFRWDLGAPRVDDGPRLLADVFRGLPSPFDQGIDAALVEPDAGGDWAVLFRGTRWIRYRLATGAPESTPPRVHDLAEWRLPAPFATGVDAILDGRGAFAANWYFFRGHQYTAVRKADRAILAPAVRSLTAWNIPFTSGVDVAFNAAGAGDGAAMFVHGEQAVAYSWSADRALGGAVPLVPTLPGVIEMLQAGAATQEARRWVEAARAALARPNAATTAALVTHFKAGWPRAIGTIRASFASLATRLAAMPHRYRFRTAAEAVADWAPNPVGGPAYHAGGIISFTAPYVRQNEMSQAAMVVHEMVHSFDAGSGDNSNVHVSEWELTTAIQIAAGLTMRTVTYPAQATAQAIHNPSAYAAFAQQIQFGVDTRFGAGRRNDVDVTAPFPGSGP